jgi:predicted nucleic acid-binding Zn ribbon protein
MDEGLDKDDMFRMVEDEFLDMAKQFTQHLHAAEYQRLKKAARSQNAAVINSISRPVSIRMPDQTRRKVESVTRAKKQAAALQGLVRKQGRGSGSDEDSDNNGVVDQVWKNHDYHSRCGRLR